VERSNTTQENPLLPTRLNAEPAIFRGCSLSELMGLSALGAMIWLPFWLLLCGFFGLLMMGVGIALLSTIAWVVIGATVLQKLKRGRPIGYYTLNIRLRLEDLKLIPSSFVRRSGVWDIGRHQ
jgi:conjugative transfer region protein (TIGR03750 family)